MTILKLAKAIQYSRHEKVIFKIGREWACVDRRFIADAGAYMIDRRAIFINPKKLDLPLYNTKGIAEMIEGKYESGAESVATSEREKAEILS